VSSTFRCATSSSNSTQRRIFPTEGKYLAHADDPYNRKSSPAIPRVPAGDLLIDQATYDRWFSPSVPAAQRLANISRRVTELGLSSLSNLLLVHRCADIRAGLTSHGAGAPNAAPILDGRSSAVFLEQRRDLGQELHRRERLREILHARRGRELRRGRVSREAGHE
jgi:hypothetical protein